MNKPVCFEKGIFLGKRERKNSSKEKVYRRWGRERKLNYYYYYYYFINSFCSQGPVHRSWVFTLFTMLSSMPGFETELLRPQPGVLPMSYTHSLLLLIYSLQKHTVFKINICWCRVVLTALPPLACAATRPLPCFHFLLELEARSSQAGCFVALPTLCTTCSSAYLLHHLQLCLPPAPFAAMPTFAPLAALSTSCTTCSSAHFCTFSSSAHLLHL